MARLDIPTDGPLHEMLKDIKRRVKGRLKRMRKAVRKARERERTLENATRAMQDLTLEREDSPEELEESVELEEAEGSERPEEPGGSERSRERKKKKKKGKGTTPGFEIGAEEMNGGGRGFGTFNCSSCENFWYSGNARKCYKQKCNSCNNWTLAKRLYPKLRRYSKSKISHFVESCEYCKIYKCDCSKLP